LWNSQAGKGKAGSEPKSYKIHSSKVEKLWKAGNEYAKKGRRDMKNANSQIEFNEKCS